MVGKVPEVVSSLLVKLKGRIDFNGFLVLLMLRYR